MKSDHHLVNTVIKHQTRLSLLKRLRGKAKMPSDGPAYGVFRRKNLLGSAGITGIPLENKPVPSNIPDKFVAQSASGVAKFVAVRKMYLPPGVVPEPVKIKVFPSSVGGLIVGNAIKSKVTGLVDTGE
jgi:hypothetical protein